MIFFENKLLLQSDVVFDSESNGRNFSLLAPPGGEKKNYFQFYFSKSPLTVTFHSTIRKVLYVSEGSFLKYFFEGPDCAAVFEVIQKQFFFATGCKINNILNSPRTD